MNPLIETDNNPSVDLSANIEMSTPEAVSMTEAPSAEVMMESVSIPAKGASLPAQLLTPASTAGSSPAAVIFVHDTAGPDDWMRACALRLAENGFTLVAPDLFANAPPPADDGEVARQDFLLALSDSKIVGDLLSTVDWLIARGHAYIGIIGWGWGGAYALMAAAHDARVRAVVNIGGTVSYPVSTPNRLGSPLNFVADLEGAMLAAFPGADPQFPANEIERLRGRLIEHDKIGEIKVYPDAPPHFWRDDQSPHTQLLWRRLTSFLRDHLLEADDDNPAFGEGYPNEASRLHA